MLKLVKHPNFTTFLMVLALFGVFAFAQYLDTPDNHVEWSESDDLLTQQIEQSIKASKEFEGKERCGPGASHEWKGDDLFCHPKRGETYAAH